MEKTPVPERINVTSSLLMYAMETNVLLNVMCDILAGIRTKDMTQEEKDKFNEKFSELLKHYREKAKTFLIEAK